MRVVAALISTVVAVQAFIPENVFRTVSKSNDAFTSLKATHYESIAETRQVNVS